MQGPSLAWQAGLGADQPGASLRGPTPSQAERAPSQLRPALHPELPEPGPRWAAVGRAVGGGGQGRSWVPATHPQGCWGTPAPDPASRGHIVLEIK